MFNAKTDIRDAFARCPSSGIYNLYPFPGLLLDVVRIWKADPGARAM